MRLLREGREETATTSATGSGAAAAASTTRAARTAHASLLDKNSLEFLALRALLSKSSLEILTLLSKGSLEILALLLGGENARGGALHCLEQHIFIAFHRGKFLGIVEVTSHTECGSELLVGNGEIRLPAK